MHTEASAHPELNKDQDVVADTDPKGPEDMYSDSSFLPVVPEDHEVLFSGARYEENTQNTSYYDVTMDLDVANIDENYNNIWRTIYEAIDEGSFFKVKIFPRAFINICKKASK